jgi:Family of unknown function (DUF5706)
LIFVFIFAGNKKSMRDFYHRAEFSLKRFDNHFSNINTKGIFYLTINTFFIGLTISLASWLQSKFNITELTGFFLTLFVLCCFGTIMTTLLAINPFLKNGETYGKSKSIFYYGSIADYSCADFKKRLQDISEDELQEDISTQLHTLAKGLKRKYQLLSISGVLVISEFIILIPIIIMLTINKK